MNVSRSKITFELILQLSFLLYLASTEEYKLDTFSCTRRVSMFYELVALCVTGKVSNYYIMQILVHFIPQLK